MFLYAGFPLFFEYPLEIYWSTPAHLRRLSSEGTPLAAHWKKGIHATKPCYAFLSAQLSTPYNADSIRHLSTLTVIELSTLLRSQLSTFTTWYCPTWLQRLDPKSSPNRLPNKYPLCHHSPVYPHLPHQLARKSVTTRNQQNKANLQQLPPLHLPVNHPPLRISINEKL